MDIWAKKKIGAEASQYADRHGGALMFGLFMAGCAFVSVWLALFWFVSPLAIGFSDWPDDPAQRELFSRLYDLSWHAGIPLLLLSQPAAWLLAWRGWRIAAQLLSVLVIFGFLALILVIMRMPG